MMVKGQGSSRHTSGKGASHGRGGAANQTGKQGNASGSESEEVKGGYRDKRGGKHPRNTLFTPPEK